MSKHKELVGMFGFGVVGERTLQSAATNAVIKGTN